MFILADNDGKNVECQAGVFSPKDKENKIDWCRAKMTFKTNDKIGTQEDLKDGKLNGAGDKGANDQWNFEDEGPQDCKADTNAISLGVDGDKFCPVMAWYKNAASGDGDDLALALLGNYTLQWKIKAADTEAKGSFAGFYLDDPMNSVLGNANSLVAGAASMAALVIATIA
jgi:hypothetical protein